jgi:hypothetical protein
VAYLSKQYRLIGSHVPDKFTGAPDHGQQRISSYLHPQPGFGRQPLGQPTQ